MYGMVIYSMYMYIIVYCKSKYPCRTRSLVGIFLSDVGLGSFYSIFCCQISYLIALL